MLKECIQRITTQFTNEALNSPMLHEDMAALEKYMAESYSDRAFIELIQNADDADSDRVYIDLIEDNLIVANDGRPFTEKDILSICRSGSSNKVRGVTIGYRGVGFKSTTSFSEDILISSANTRFSFSKKMVAQLLEVPKEKVPTVRIPILVSESSVGAKTNEMIYNLHREGYNTVFVFCNVDADKCIRELILFSN